MVDAIRTSLTNGDLGAAGKVLWAGLQVEWQKGTLALRLAWISLSSKLLDVWNELWSGLQSVFQIGLHALESAWITIANKIGVVWDNLFGAIKKAWNSVVTPAAKAILYVQGIFDDSIDVDAAFAELDRSAADYKASVDEQVADSVDARNQAAADKQDRADERHQEVMTGIGIDADKRSEEISDQASAGITAAADRLREAEDELKAAIAAVRSGDAAGAETAGGGTALDGALQSMLDGLEAALDRSGLSSRGTFSAAAAADLGSRKREEEMVSLTKDIASTNKQIARAVREGGPVFT